MKEKIAKSILSIGLISALMLGGCKGNTAQNGEADIPANETETLEETTEEVAEEAEDPTVEMSYVEPIVYTINGDGYTITVDQNIGINGYEVASDGNESGKLTADMRASNILSSQRAEDGKSSLNHPNGIATDGTHFVVCDTWNNRVLVWNTLPTEYALPDVVIGQEDFETFEAGDGDDKLNWPVAVTFAGEKLIIADTHNYRLMVYDEVPTENGAAADHIITQMSSSDGINWPWAVWSDGERLIVTSTMSGKVGFWNSVDEAVEGEFADYVINTKGTPRTIVTNGDFLLIGDHNLNDGPERGSHVWLHYPTSASSKPDFDVDIQMGGGFINDNLVGFSIDNNFYSYYGIIDSQTEEYATMFGSRTGYMQGGDCGQLLYVDGRTYVSYYNSSIIGIYEGKITKDNYMFPKAILGADDLTQSATVDRGIYQNPAVATDGESLIFVDDRNRLIGVYTMIPDSNNVIADYVYRFPMEWDEPIDVAVGSDGKTVVLTANSLLIWNKLPVSGELYDERIEFDHDIDRNSSKIEITDDAIIIYSQADGMIYELPRDGKFSSFDDDCICSVKANDISGLTFDGEYLIASGANSRKVIIYSAEDLSVYGEVGSNDPSGWFNQPNDAIHLPNGQFVVADQDKLYVWESLDEAIADKKLSNCFNMGDLDDYEIDTIRDGESQPEVADIATDGSLFRPTYLCYANGHLWVGEFKFSSRIVRYDLK